MADRITIGRRAAAEQASADSMSDAPRASYDTTRHDTKRHPSFSTRMSFSMMIIVVITVLTLLVALLAVWYVPGRPALTAEEYEIRQSTFGAVLSAGLIAIFFSTIMGGALANGLAKPVNRITSTARQIRNGDLTARTGLKGDDEIGKLGETFDDMAAHLEKDLALEHRLTSDVAHELRTPLMAMQATVEAMRDGVMEANDENLARIEHEVRRLSRLVDAMLKLSRMENGTTPFRPQRTEMVGLVRSIYDGQHPLFHDSGLRLRLDVDVPREETYCDVDRDMIRQAIVNLMSNALRYTEPGGYVILGITQDRTDALISVKDTGIGIAKEDLSRVFSRFWRAENSREQAAGGLGVGLAVTKEIIDRHQGYISVESELGKGTEFTLHLPRIRFSLAGAEESDPERDIPADV